MKQELYHHKLVLRHTSTHVYTNWSLEDEFFFPLQTEEQ
jgi:hypothetical protein